MPDAIRSVRDLAALVRTARLSRGWTQDELAHRAQVSRKWLSQLERGTHQRAELGHVLAVLRALDVHLTADLATDLPPAPAPPAPQRPPSRQRPAITSPDTAADATPAAETGPPDDDFNLDAHIASFRDQGSR